MAELAPTAIYAWLARHDDPEKLAGAAFLLAPRLALTCAHVVRDHLGLGQETPPGAPQRAVCLRFPALEREAKATVIPQGWYPVQAAGGAMALRDIAFLELTEPLEGEGLRYVALAAHMPGGGSIARVFGAEPGWQEHGQEIQVRLGGGLNLRGLWQLTTVDGHGFAVERGFSGGPLFGESMTIVWGMVQQVDPNGRKEAFAVGADRLQEALRRAGFVLAATVRTAGEPQELAEAAIATLREEHAARESEWAAREAKREEEMAALRDMVRGLERQATETPGEDPATLALRGLAQGDKAVAEQLLQAQMEAESAAGTAAFRRGAEAARWLGLLRLPDDAAGALASFREAHGLDPDDLQTLWWLAEAEQRAGTVAGARRAVERALSMLSTNRGKDRADWLTMAGDVARAAGDLGAARDAYQEGLGIRRALAEADPSNAEWQRDLSVSLERLGDVALAAGDLGAARDAYQEGLGIARALAARDALDMRFMGNVALLAKRLAEVLEAQGEDGSALRAEATTVARRALALPGLGALWRDLFNSVLDEQGDRSAP